MFAETVEAIEQVELNASDAWKAHALQSIRYVAETRTLFTSADVYSKMYERADAPTTCDNRAMGPVMLRAAKAGWIESTDRYEIDSVRPWCHDQPRRVWRSLIRVDVPFANTYGLEAPRDWEYSG